MDGGLAKRRGLRMLDTKQNTEISPDFGKKCRMGLGMKCRFAGSPVQTLEMIDQHGAFDVVENGGQGKWIWLTAASEWANHREATGAIVALIGDDQSRAALGLLTAGFGAESLAHKR